MNHFLKHDRGERWRPPGLCAKIYFLCSCHYYFSSHFQLRWKHLAFSYLFQIQIFHITVYFVAPYAKCWESLRGGPHVPTVSEDIQPSCGASTISHRSNHTPHPYFSSCSVPFVHRRLPSTKHWNQRQAGGETGFEHNITCGSPPKAALLRSLYGR